jgi:hypothetical protein
MFTPIEFQRARDFSKKLNATFEFIKQNFKSLAKSLLYIAGPPLLVGSVLAGGLYTDYFSFIGTLTKNPDQVGLGFEGIFGSTTILFVKIGGAIFFMLASGVMIVSVVYNYILEYEASKSNVIDVNTIWDRVRNTLPMYIGTLFLFWLMTIAGYLLILGVIIGSAVVSGFLAFLAGIAVVVGFVYMVVTLSLVFIIRAYEKTGFFEAIQRSFFLIRDKWWSTFGLLVIIALIQSTIASIFLVPWYINFFVSMMHSLETSPVPQTSVVGDLINNVFMTLYFLVSFLMYALPLIALAFQYFNLIELKEAKGLLSRIESFGQTPEVPKQDEQY